VCAEKYNTGTDFRSPNGLLIEPHKIFYSAGYFAVGDDIFDINRTP
jgi:hypothetical protein